MWVKICGIQTMKAAVAAAEAGADAVGFIFAPSRRQITVERAESLIMGLPTQLQKVGVFVDATVEQMQRIVEEAHLTAIQMHGSEPPAWIEQVSLPVIKAFRIRSSGDLAILPAYGRAAALLLDPYVEGQHGGTGQTLDWRLAVEAADLLEQAGIPLAQPGEPLTVGRPRLILAGGLTPDNVEEAIRQGRPGGVDVSSGVETDGQKDVDKIYDFVLLAKEGRT